VSTRRVIVNVSQRELIAADTAVIALCEQKPNATRAEITETAAKAAVTAAGPPKVYVVEEGVYHERSVIAVCGTLERATEEAEERYGRDRAAGDAAWEGFGPEWRNEAGGSLHLITITEFEVAT
jgi:hypothetical protein